MNPMTNMKNVKKLSEQELAKGSKSSWHDQYNDSAWIFIGGFPYDLTEGDIICIFSQYGEIVNINLIRAKDTGKSKGFCFICYEDQRSTILAVDNLNGIKILNRTIRVDHVADYKVPKEGKNTDEETKKLYAEGCAPKTEPIVRKMKIEPNVKKEPRNDRDTMADQIQGDIKLPPRLPIYTDIKQEIKEESVSDEEKSKKKKKKSKKKSKKKNKKSKNSDLSDETSSEDKKRDKSPVRVKDKVKNQDRNSERYNSPDRKYDYLTGSSGSKNYKEKYPKRRDRSKSRSKDTDDKKRYKRESSPYIPKRYR